MQMCKRFNPYRDSFMEVYYNSHFLLFNHIDQSSNSTCISALWLWLRILNGIYHPRQKTWCMQQLSQRGQLTNRSLALLTARRIIPFMAALSPFSSISKSASTMPIKLHMSSTPFSWAIQCHNKYMPCARAHAMWKDLESLGHFDDDSVIVYHRSLHHGECRAKVSWNIICLRKLL